MNKANAKLAAGDNTPEKHRTLREPWKPGESGNPAGRPKGSRNKIAEAFIDDLYASWLVHGADAIRRMCEERPHDYVKVAASLMPRQFDVTNKNPFDEISDQDELEDMLIVLREMIAKQKNGGNAPN